MITLLLSLTFASPSLPCPTHATPGTIIIEGQRYGVNGYANRLAMRERVCDPVAFDEWRRQVRLSRTTGVVGVVLWPAWIATGVHWVRAAGMRREVLSQSNMEVE